MSLNVWIVCRTHELCRGICRQFICGEHKLFSEFILVLSSWSLRESPSHKSESESVHFV